MSSIVKHLDYNVNKLTFEQPVGQFKKKSTMNILFPSYDGAKSPLIQLPTVELDMYGIPSRCDFYKEDTQRMFLKLPLNHNKPEIRLLINGFLRELDDKFGSDEYKEKLLGAKKSRYTYQPILRHVLHEDGTPNKERHPYMKIKLLTKYPSNEIETCVREQMKDHSIITHYTETLDKIEPFFKLRSKIRCVIAPVKLWIQPATSSDCMYGISFKLIKVLVSLPLVKTLKEQMLENDDDFIESESENSC